MACPPVCGNLDINSEPVKETIRTLVAKNVAITSTLPVFEAMRRWRAVQAESQQPDGNRRGERAVESARAECDESPTRACVT